jgi:hypothetical protein
MAKALRSNHVSSVSALLALIALVAAMEVTVAAREVTKTQETVAPTTVPRRAMTKYISYGAIRNDPTPNGPPQNANNYTRGCNPIMRCRPTAGAA